MAFTRPADAARLILNIEFPSRENPEKFLVRRPALDTRRWARAMQL